MKKMDKKNWKKYDDDMLQWFVNNVLIRSLYLKREYLLIKFREGLDENDLDDLKITLHTKPEKEFDEFVERGMQYWGLTLRPAELYYLLDKPTKELSQQEMDYVVNTMKGVMKMSEGS